VPETASSAILSLYNFPPRPASGRAALVWDRVYGHAKATPAPPFVVEPNISLASGVVLSPAAPGSALAQAPLVHGPKNYLTYENIAGFGGIGKNKKCASGCYGSTVFGFREPSLHHSSCKDNAEATFDMIGGLGLNGRSSTEFAQVGTIAWQGYKFKGFAQHQPYLFGAGPMKQPLGLPGLNIKPGNTVYGMMSLRSTASQNGGVGYIMAGFIENDKNMHDDSLSVYPLSRKTAGTDYSMTSASWGIERPLVPGTKIASQHYTNLSNFGTFDYILGGDNLGIFTNGTYDEFSMLVQNRSMEDAAVPNPVNKNGQSFSIKFYLCQ
jgi:hypothetical protein